MDRLDGVGDGEGANGQAPGQNQTPPPSTTQAPANNESTSKTAGDYAVQQSIEFGYRDSLINGNLNNYDTFENLTSGVRLFDYSVDMRSIDHKGILFDNLSFINSGYGGDPNDISRLRIDKSNVYDFRVMFRQDKNYWNYNLLANPLNPTTGPIPGESDRQLAARARPDPQDAGLRSDAFSAVSSPGPGWIFAQRRQRTRSPPRVEGGTEPLLN